MTYLIRFARKCFQNKTADEVHDMAYSEFLHVLEAEANGNDRKTAYQWAMNMKYREYSRYKVMKYEDLVEDSQLFFVSQVPQQMNRAAASQALRLVERLPERHRDIMLLLADGADPVEISEETDTPLLDVLNVIREARRWLANGGAYLHDG